MQGCGTRNFKITQRFVANLLKTFSPFNGGGPGI
jgi:hypothetical protein